MEGLVRELYVEMERLLPEGILAEILRKCLSRFHLTHPDFTSIQPSVTRGMNTAHFLLHLLDSFHQPSYHRCVPPIEKNYWNEDELQSFELTPCDIERVYYMVTYTCGIHSGCILLARIRYENKPLYVELVGGCKLLPSHGHDEDCNASGLMFMSRDANCFMMTVLNRKMNCYPVAKIFNSLEQDEIEHQTEVVLNKVYWNNPHKLNQLCLRALYNYRRLLPDKLLDQLPPVLSKYVRNWIRQTKNICRARQLYNSSRVEHVSLTLRHMSEKAVTWLANKQGKKWNKMTPAAEQEEEEEEEEKEEEEEEDPCEKLTEFTLDVNDSTIAQECEYVFYPPV